ncbi:MAG TPA: N-acetylglucosamine-6-phosphate deacetylase [Thermotogota bacterium]|nr:N-acetylglucosamine-6-phosphate deacetylase [Thermotogota bacterium]HRW34107.1 N-acetylglucosamine-6-phosphate deacetylase [Thermotogota bacterium]
MIIEHVNVFTPDVVIPSSRVIFEERIEAIESSEPPSRDRYYLMPGFVDTHIHGCVGEDFSNTDFNGISQMEKFLYSRGVTTVLATTLSLPFDAIRKVVALIRNYREQHPITSIAGIHLEGPFINIKKKGAQNPDYIKSPEDRELDFILQNKDLIKVITLAPEVAGDETIQLLSSNGITVSIGHTCADYHRSLEAIQSGASRFTHLFNAMRPLHHRDLGTSGAGLLSDAYVEVICDLIHLSPETIQLVFKTKNPDRIIFISDAMEATGLEPGQYSLGGLEVFVDEHSARLKDHTLAGSVLKLNDALINANRILSIPLEDILKCLTKNPSVNSNLDSGFIDIGKPADLVLMDQDLTIIKTIKNGQTVFEK